MTNHVLKTAAPFWDAQAIGIKNFEIRFNDRGFATGDTLELTRLPAPGENARGMGMIPPLLRRVTYVLPGGMDFSGRVLLDPSAVIMSTVPAAPVATVENLDNMTVKHLAETLTAVRGTVNALATAIELAANMPKTAAIAREIVAKIDEALEEGGPGVRHDGDDR